MGNDKHFFEYIALSFAMRRFGGLDRNATFPFVATLGGRKVEFESAEALTSAIFDYRGTLDEFDYGQTTAELLHVEKEGTRYRALVRFSHWTKTGLLVSEVNGSFLWEIKSKSGWVLQSADLLEDPLLGEPLD